MIKHVTPEARFHTAEDLEFRNVSALSVLALGNWFHRVKVSGVDRSSLVEPEEFTAAKDPRFSKLLDTVQVAALTGADALVKAGVPMPATRALAPLASACNGTIFPAPGEIDAYLEAAHDTAELSFLAMVIGDAKKRLDIS